MKLILFFILILFFNFIFYSHPFLISLVLVFFVLSWVPLFYQLMNFGWLNYLMSLLYLGGLLIMFIYFSVIIPQEKQQFFYSTVLLSTLMQSMMSKWIIAGSPIYFLNTNILLLSNFQSVNYVILMLVLLVILLIYLSGIIRFNKMPLRMI